MKTIDEMIAVMTAYKEGKKIEKKNLRLEDSGYWGTDSCPRWDWMRNDYRVKAEPKYRPYANADEFLKGMKEHGLYMRWTDDNTMFLPHVVDKDGINFSINGTFYSWENVLKIHFWQDGSPCGVLEE